MSNPTDFPSDPSDANPIRPPTANWLVSALLLLVLILAASVIALTWFMIQAGQETEAARTAEATARLLPDRERDRANGETNAEAIESARRASQRTEELLARTERALYRSQLALAQNAFDLGNQKQAIEHLDRCQWTLRGWEHRHLWTRFAGLTIAASKQIFPRLPDITSVTFSPDGKYLAGGGEETPVKLWDTETGQEILTLKDASAPLAFSPDGARLVTGSSKNLAKIWDVKTGDEILPLRGHIESVVSVAFSPDGKSIISASTTPTPILWDATNGKMLRLFKHMEDVHEVAFSPSGTYVATGGGRRNALGSVTVWDARTGLIIFSHPGHRSRGRALAFSPDGKRLASIGEGLKIWDVPAGKEILAIPGTSDVAWSPDGRTLATGIPDGMVAIWDAETGRKIVSLGEGTNPITGVTFSPDGRRITTVSNNQVRIWDPEVGPTVFPLTGHEKPVQAVAFSPGGKLIGSVSEDGTAKVWDAVKGREVLTFTSKGGPLSSVAFSEDGKLFFAWDAQQTVSAWSTEDGVAIEPGNLKAVPPAKTGPTTNGTHIVKPNGASISVIQTQQTPPLPNHWPLPDVAERKAFHADHAALAEREHRWFAVAFHVGRLLLDDPDNADLKKRRENALARHAEK